METRSRFASITTRSTFVILMAAAMAAGCGVSKSQYMDVTKSRDELAAQNQQLQQSLDQANQEKAQAEQEKAALDSRVKQMEAVAQQEQKAEQDVKATYESMATRMQPEVTGGQVEMKNVGDFISLNLSQDVLFKPGSAELDKEGKDLLLKVAKELRSSPYQIIVTGHTDDQKIGGALAKNFPTNWELGAARSARIVRLFQEAGIAKNRLAVVSFADSRPRVANDTPDDRAKNRRIEIKLRPTSQGETAGD